VGAEFSWLGLVREHGVEPARSFAERTAHEPIRLECDGKPQAKSRVFIASPLQGRTEIPPEALEQVKRAGLLRPVQLRMEFLGNSCKPACVLSASSRCFPTFEQSRLSVLAQRLQQAEADDIGPARFAEDKRGIDQPFDRFEDHSTVDFLIDAYRIRVAQRKPAAKHGQSPKDNALSRCEHPVAPVDSRLQRLMASRTRTGAAPQQCEAVVQPNEYVTLREHANAGCCQLDRERHPVESSADLCDKSRAFPCERIAPYFPGALHEESNRLGFQNAPRR
jgi:hypothetical protein